MLMELIAYYLMCFSFHSTDNFDYLLGIEPPEKERELSLSLSACVLTALQHFK
jgi:hypothetical protein